MKRIDKGSAITLIMVIVFIVLLLVTVITGCSLTGDEQKKIDNVKDKSTSLFTVIEYNTTLDCAIVYMNANKVMYAVSQGGYSSHSEGSGVFTLLVNPDGSPMIYDEYKIK